MFGYTLKGTRVLMNAKLNIAVADVHFELFRSETRFVRRNKTTNVHRLLDSHYTQSHHITNSYRWTTHKAHDG